MVSTEFFDVFGFMAFIIIAIVGTWMLKSKERLPNWIGMVVLSIGILGIIIDGFIVIKTYIIGG